MDLNIAWFLLIGVLLAGYAVLDGFDLGVGMLQLFARNEEERDVQLATIGPVWDGNEVWLLTAAGAMFAAFPIVYATVFSGFYLAFMLLLFGLILRAVGLEFRGQIDSRGWRRCWSCAVGLGSFLPSLLFGVAIGNVLRGLPITAEGTLNVSLLELLNPYALLVGLLSLTMFVMHGAAFLAARTDGQLRQRMARCTIAAWVGFVVLYATASGATMFVSPFLLEGLVANPLMWILLVLLTAAAVCVPIAVRAERFLIAFLASATSIASTIGLMGLGLFPRMVPSSIDLAHSLTIYNASSTPLTLRVMLVIALIGMPLVIGYTAMIYTIFMRKGAPAHDGY